MHAKAKQQQGASAEVSTNDVAQAAEQTEVDEDEQAPFQRKSRMRCSSTMLKLTLNERLIGHECDLSLAYLPLKEVGRTLPPQTCNLEKCRILKYHMSRFADPIRFCQFILKE